MSHTGHYNCRCSTSVTYEQSAELIRVAQKLVEFYAYKIAFEKMDDG